MNRKNKILVTIITLVFFALNFTFVLANPTNDCVECSLAGDMCTAILIGKDASIDGSTMTLQTADCGMCDFRFYYVPAEEHEPGSVRSIHAIPQLEDWPLEEEKAGLSKE